MFSVLLTLFGAARSLSDEQSNALTTFCQEIGFTETCTCSSSCMINLFLPAPPLIAHMKDILCTSDHVVSIRFDSKSLKTSFPSVLGRLTGLTACLFGNNALSGTVPTQIGRLTQLEGLLLHGNDLNGTLPTRMARLTALTNIFINGNRFTGRFPDTSRWSMDLRYFGVNINYFVGPLPDPSRWRRLRKFLANDNFVSGDWPIFISNELETIHLGGNLLRGPRIGSANRPSGNCGMMNDDDLQPNAMYRFRCFNQIEQCPSFECRCSNANVSPINAECQTLHVTWLRSCPPKTLRS